MTKAELVSHVAKEAKITKKAVDAVLTSLMEAVQLTPEPFEDVFSTYARSCLYLRGPRSQGRPPIEGSIKWRD